MKKYYFIATLVILAGLYSYHFLAAEKAEEQINDAIQQQVSEHPDSLNVQYSKLDISPFSGNMTFSDLNIIGHNYIERVQKLTFDLTYWDFLTIYFGGLEAGLNQGDSYILVAENISLLQRKELREANIKFLQATYSGNLWQTLRSILTKTSLQKEQQITLNATTLHYSQPDSKVGSFKSDSINATIQIIHDGNTFRTQTKTRFSKVTWTPPVNFQRSYEFFIKGFGFQQDSIPIQEAVLSLDINSGIQQITLNESTITTNLAKINISGNAKWITSVSESRVDTLTVRASELSEQLRNILSNAEKLFGIGLPQKGNDIVIKLSGKLDSLKVIE